jgi:hypothetical protein
MNKNLIQYFLVVSLSAAIVGSIFTFTVQSVSGIHEQAKFPTIKLNSTSFDKAEYNVVGVVLCNANMSDCMVAPFPK